MNENIWPCNKRVKSINIYEDNIISTRGIIERDYEKVKERRLNNSYCR